MEPAEFSVLVKETFNAWQGLGQVVYGPTEAEKFAVTRRRSIYIVEDLKVGSVITRENIRCIRPGHGIAPKFFESLLGKKLKQDAKKGTPMHWDLLA